MSSAEPIQTVSEARPVALRCAGLVKRFGELVAVDHLDLEVYRGECFGLLGPNGAGKTTTVEMLEGLLPPDAGEIELLGRRWGQGRDREIRQQLGIQLQETKLAEKLTVRETVRLFRSFYDRGPTVDQAIETAALVDKRSARVGKLSGGQRQRLALACALVSSPELLFLDEPTTGLDPQARRNVWQLVEGFKEQGGTALLTTHYMDEAARLCDRLAIIDRGRVIALGSPDELIASLEAEQIVRLECRGEVSEPALVGLPGVAGVARQQGAFVIRVDDIGAALPGLLARLELDGAELEALTTHQPTLEDVFVHLTGRELRDA
jgi:ABC-2 type transport system ATP-binding protein